MKVVLGIPENDSFRLKEKDQIVVVYILLLSTNSGLEKNKIVTKANCSITQNSGIMYKDDISYFPVTIKSNGLQKIVFTNRLFTQEFHLSNDVSRVNN